MREVTMKKTILKCLYSSRHVSLKANVLNLRDLLPNFFAPKGRELMTLLMLLIYNSQQPQL